MGSKFGSKSKYTVSKIPETFKDEVPVVPPEKVGITTNKHDIKGLGLLELLVLKPECMDQFMNISTLDGDVVNMDLLSLIVGGPWGAINSCMVESPTTSLILSSV